MRVVFDTNVLISAFISKGTPYHLLSKALEGEFELMISPDIFDEFRNVINREKFKLSIKQIEESSMILFRVPEMIQPLYKVNVVHEDPDDDRILECAMSSHADLIISGDRHLLQLTEWEGIKILTPSKALEFIGRVSGQ